MSNEMDARLLWSSSHIHTHRGEEMSVQSNNASLPCTDTQMLKCKCTCTLTTITGVLVLACMFTRTNFSHGVSFQTPYILLSCAAISRINEEVSRFTVKQHVRLWRTNAWSLQFLKSVFNSVIDF